MSILAKLFFISACSSHIEAPHPPTWSEAASLDPGTQTSRVFVTGDNHDLVLLLRREGSADLVPVKVSLHNGIKPSVAVTVKRSSSGYRYEYTVRNGTGARDSVISFEIVAPPLLLGTDVAFLENGVRSNQFWSGGPAFANIAKQIELDKGTVGRYILWVAAWDEAHANSELVNILPGREKSGFEVDSPLRPGFTTCLTAGLPYSPPEIAFDDDQVVRQLTSLKIDNYFDITSLTFGPMFLPSALPGEVLQNYRLGISKLRKCVGLPHSEAFLDEVARILSLPDAAPKLPSSLDHMTAKPSSPIEQELMSCLRLVAQSFVE